MEKIKGKIWIIKDEAGKLIDNIDTDQIYHNKHLAITDINQMGQYTFGNLSGWENFPEKTSQGDIVVVGKNFGAGSSRQQAVDCFRALGIALIMAESFGAIYKRNAINSALPIMTVPKLSLGELKNGNILEIDFKSGEILNLTAEEKVKGDPFSPVQLDILKAGGLFNYGKEIR